ncbi:uncharacterized protein FFMR_08802 [Fusarium fujikuroi]|nr:uncharacterized protein FFM5_05923 [Fusarium fujikuroi]SCO31001.1 uncharacterized protein FFNC_01693 [Fusarium fujikuroi]SCO47015.1 uncharacterized protein FFMR_08802 [Fusarium fujikuroi]SCV28343.1 uncharacterized protein FFB14_01675 [Fusarium fujikuroi]SCV41242.1 uncharacterized protein FFFS_06315 [Fusarium fujikuroi]
MYGSRSHKRLHQACENCRRFNTDSVSVGGRRLGVRERDQLARAALAFQKRARTQKFEGIL